MTEKNIILDFSVKSCEKGAFYKIILNSKDKYIGLSKPFETEELSCLDDNKEIHFKEKLPLYFNFIEMQEVDLTFIKNIPDDKQLKFNKLENLRRTYLSSIISSKNSSYERNLKGNPEKKDIFCIKANKYNDGNNNKITNKLFEFLKSGIKLNNFIAFDFSQGKNRQKREKSFVNFTKIIQKIKDRTYFYANHHMSYLYGFGGKLITDNIQNINDNIFNINFQNNSPVKLDNICEVFNSSLDKINPLNPVSLPKLIRFFTKKIYDLYEVSVYNILFIITREIIEAKEKQELIDAIIESCFLPLTIVLLGEGYNDFYKLRPFFEEQIKETKIGIKRPRNNIIFKDFRDFDESSSKFMNWCLEEISKHIIEFYDLIKCTPEQIEKNNLNNVKQSFNNYNETSFFIYQSYINPIREEDKINIIKEEKKEEININNEKIEKNEINETVKKKEKEVDKNKNIDKNIDKNKNEEEEKETDKGIFNDGNKQEIKFTNGTPGNIPNKLNNPFLKFTPGGSFNKNINNISNPYNPKNIDKNMDSSIQSKNSINNNDNPIIDLKKYKVTSINNFKIIEEEEPKKYIAISNNNFNFNNEEENPKKNNDNNNIEDSESKKYIITPGKSICTPLDENPYNIKNNQNNKKYIINNESVMDPISKMENPYDKNKNENENKIEINSVSTKESGQTSSDNSYVKINDSSKLFNKNYSIDNY